MKKPIIEVMVKQPGHKPFRVSCLNELETMQSLVEGDTSKYCRWRRIS